MVFVITAARRLFFRQVTTLAIERHYILIMDVAIKMGQMILIAFVAEQTGSLSALVLDADSVGAPHDRSGESIETSVRLSLSRGSIFGGLGHSAESRSQDC